MEYSVNQEITDALSAIVSDETVKKAIAHTVHDHDLTIEQQMKLAATPAPTFNEGEKAALLLAYFKDLKLDEAYIDTFGNAVGVRRGSGKAEPIMLEAHLDSIHAPGTDMSNYMENGVLYGNTVRHNSRAVAVMLSVIRSLNAGGVKTKGDIYFVGTIHEEGMGGMGGMKAFVAEHPDFAAYISLDGALIDRITYQSTGFNTSEVIFHGAGGGHAYGAFGTIANPAHAAGRAVGKIANIDVPQKPKTTFSVSRLEAGNDANVHSIVPKAMIKFNLRSTDKTEFDKLYNSVFEAIEQACEEETAKWGKDTITSEIKTYLSTPAASLDIHAPIVEAAYAVISHLGVKPIFNEGGSANCCVPISLGKPGICLGGEIANFVAGEKVEFFDTKDAYIGVQQVMLTALMASGVETK